MNGGISLGFANTKGDVGESTRKAKSLKEEIKEKIFQMQQIPINKKVLMSGENGTAKSSLALGIMTYNLKPDEVIIYIDVDNSGLEIVQNFYSKEYNNNQILVYRPNQIIEPLLIWIANPKYIIDITLKENYKERKYENRY